MKFSRRAAVGGLLLLPPFCLGLAKAAPLCGGLTSGAVQASGASTVCDFTAQTTADGTVSSISFSDFTITGVHAGAKIEKLFAAYHTFAPPAGYEPFYLGRATLDGTLDSEGVSGIARIDVRLGALR